jgi:thymidine kinase
MSSRGYLCVWPGPMYGGKSSRVIKELTSYADITEMLNKQNHSDHSDLKESSSKNDYARPLYVNHIYDLQRDDKKQGATSHSSQFNGLSHLIDHVHAEKLSNVDVSKHKVIGVDEAQFYPDLYQTIRRWVCQEGKHVYVAGLDSYASGEIFGEIHLLLHISDKFEKVCGICSDCMNDRKSINSITTPDHCVPAPFTSKLINAKDNNIGKVEVGGQDKYLPVCGYHFDIRNPRS